MVRTRFMLRGRRRDGRAAGCDKGVDSVKSVWLNERDAGYGNELDILCLGSLFGEEDGRKMR